MEAFIKYGAGVLAVVALVLTFVFHSQPNSPQFGAVSSLSGATSQSPLALNGINHWYVPEAFNTASSTLCAFKTTATTTLSAVGIQFTSSIGYSNIYELGVGTTIGATTTAIIASYTVPSNALASFNATSTATFSQTYNDGILPPNTWVDFNVSTSTATGKNQVTGFCTFEGRGMNISY